MRQSAVDSQQLRFPVNSWQFSRQSSVRREEPMKRMRNSVAVVVCLLIVSSAAAQDKPPSAQAAEPKRGRTFIDALEQQIVGDPQLSPDGKTILFTVDRADWKSNRRIGHIYRIGVNGTGQVQL